MQLGVMLQYLILKKHVTCRIKAQQQHRRAPCKIKECSLVCPLQSKHGLHIQCFTRMSGKHLQKLELYEPC